MPAASEFDRFFLNLPPFDREKDFDDFWKSAISDLKKIPMEPEFHPRGHASSRFDVFSVSYKGFNRSPVSGELHIPRHAKKPRVVVIIPDYNRPNPYVNYALDQDIAYFFLDLRGHNMIRPESPDQAASPGYMIENITEAGGYYVKGVYLDAYRAIDALRLNDKIDCSSIGIIGKGLGAAAAVFTASYSGRVGSLVLETPSFCYLDLGQNLSTGDMANEINEYLVQHKNRKKQVKKNLSYFDVLNFSDKISVPVLAVVGFRDTISPPSCVFALFNHLLCEKTIEVYPDKGNEAGEEIQFRKSLTWMKSILLRG